MSLKSISEFPTDGMSNPFTITHTGKQRLMERAYERYKQTTEHLDRLDNAYMFFTHAFHLKEWIQHFSGKKDFVTNWKQNYASNQYYLLCQDFCNKSKHFNLTRPEVTNSISLIERRTFTNGNSTTTYYIRYDDKFIEMDLLIDKLLDFWHDYFRREL